MTLVRNTDSIMMRNYGRIIQNMVGYACSIQDEVERQALTIYIAQCMAQKNIIWNKEQEIGTQRVINDIRRLSDNKLDVDFPELQQALERTSYTAQGQQNFNKKKKK